MAKIWILTKLSHLGSGLYFWPTKNMKLTLYAEDIRPTTKACLVADLLDNYQVLVDSDHLGLATDKIKEASHLFRALCTDIEWAEARVLVSKEVEIVYSEVLDAFWTLNPKQD